MNFNSYIKNNWVSKCLLSILIIAFILSSISGIIFMTNKYNVVVVDNKKVNINEFVRVLNGEKQKIFAYNQDMSQIDFLNSREFMIMTLNNVVNSSLLDKEIENYRINEPNEIILSKIYKEHYFYTDNKFDITKLRNLLKNYNMTEYDYMEMIRINDNIEFLESLISGIGVNNLIAVGVFNIENKYKEISLFSINKKLLKVDDVEASEADIKEYYNKNIDKFTILESRKVDYIKIDDFKADDVSKVEELLSTSNNIADVAKNLNLEVNSFDYVDATKANDLLKKYNIGDIFSYKVNDFSGVKTVDNALYVFSVVDIKNERVQTLEEVKNDIRNIIVTEAMNNNYKKVVLNYINDYRNGGYKNNILTVKGFKIKKDKVSKNKESNYDKNFVDEVLASKNMETTGVFLNENDVYFAFVNDEGIVGEDDDSFVSINLVEQDLEASMLDDIKRQYTGYLTNKKYNVKVNYKLLDLIRRQ
ncbi:MAG: peptidyl-prolyl cis-trans isomerase [Rickettsiales bacterium]|nr:peptidyl-prolyl cis-trans isomerase [Rickettsiales bacterium]